MIGRIFAISSPQLVTNSFVPTAPRRTNEFVTTWRSKGPAARIELAASRLRIECSAVRASRALECAAVTVSSRIPNLPAALCLFHCESLTVHQSFGRSNAPGESRTRIVPVTAYSLRRRGRYGSNKAGHAGFEPAASWLTTKRALRAAPMARGNACEIRTHDLQLEKLPAWPLAQRAISAGSRS